LKKTFVYYAIFLFTLLYSEDNPWIYTSNPEPVVESIVVISLGAGSGGWNDDEMVSFKYAFLNKSSNNSYSGYSISGYSQDAGDCYYDWYYGWDCYEYESTNYLFGYTKLQAIINKDEFKGLYYGYDVGLTFTVWDNHPLGLSLEPISAFFDDDKRSNIGLGVRAEIGYAMKSFMLSMKFGLDFIGDDDIFFIDGGFEDLDDRFQFTILNLSYKF